MSPPAPLRSPLSRKALDGKTAWIGLRLCIAVLSLAIGAIKANAQCVAYLVPISVPVYTNPDGKVLWLEKRSGFLLALPEARRDYRPESYVKVQEMDRLILPVFAGCLPTSFRRSQVGRVKVYVSQPKTGELMVAWVSEKDCISVVYRAPAGLTVGVDVQSAAENLRVIREAALQTLRKLSPTPLPAPGASPRQ